MGLFALLTKIRSVFAEKPIADEREFFNCMTELYFRNHGSSVVLQQEASKVFLSLPTSLRTTIAKVPVVVQRMITSSRRTYLVRPAWAEDPETFEELLALSPDESHEYDWGLSFIWTASKYSSRGTTLKHL